MIGQISGTSSNIAELKSLMDLVSDPKKVKAALDELHAAAQDVKKLLEEKSAVESGVEAKLKKLASDAADFESRSAEIKLSEIEVNAAQKNLDVSKRDLKLKLSKFDADQASFQSDLSAHVAQVEHFDAIFAEKTASLDARFAEAKALKSEYESKIAKLKQALG